MACFLPFLFILMLSATASQATFLEKDYWNNIFPNTPMPNAVLDLIRPDVHDVGKSANGKVQLGDGGGKANFCEVGHSQYRDPATDAQINNNPCSMLYILETELHPGAKMIVQFPRTPTDATFLPHWEADSIPFSSKKLPEILNHLSIEPNSLEAEAMKKTLHECEKLGGDEEHKYCATSLESMVEFSTSTLGTHQILALSTKVGLEGSQKQVYTFEEVQRIPGSKLVACHAEAYPYAVFYCHTLRATWAYTVKMVGADGTAVEALAVCHADTAWWHPGHLAFHMLKVKPGEATICHLLRRNQIVWAPTK